LSIRVLVVDDHAVVRSGLRRVLDAEDDIETVGEAPNADRAIFEALEHKPDVVLMDVTMPDKSGVEALPALLQSVPDTRVLMLSMHDDPGYVRAAFEAGERYVHPALGAKLIAAEAEERRRAETDPLSEREREVLRLLALGHTNQEIASMLYISVRTAETHRAHIMQKLRLSSRAQLVRYALDSGLIETSD
jgi:two-component system, NarL family, response regulator NreC